ALSEVKRAKTWERWGYDSFETYAKTELKLRSDTVEKLTGSYMFLHKRAPEDNTIPKETLIDVRKQILDDGVPVAKVARLYNDTLFPASEHDKREANR